MKILFVAMSESIHVAKWLALCCNLEDKLHLFPSNLAATHPGIDIKRIDFIDTDPLVLRLFRRLGSRAYKKAKTLLRLVYKVTGSPDSAASLARTIRRISPDLIHSMETQHAGYLVLECKERFFSQGSFPLWLHTNWGSDIFLYGRLDGHREKIKKIMGQCDFYTCESQRDIALGYSFGFKGRSFAPFPNACGFDLETVRGLREEMPARARKTILVKGYQNWSGRALFALSALAMVAEGLKGYKILIFSSAGSEEVGIAARLLQLDHGLDVGILEKDVPHQRMLELFASSRIYLGLSISDGISTSLLEAMAMGAFPIQSNTSTAEEWIQDGTSGFIVPPEDPRAVASRLAVALREDELVDSASAINWETISRSANSSQIMKQVSAIYQAISETALRAGRIA